MSILQKENSLQVKFCINFNHFSGVPIPGDAFVIARTLSFIVSQVQERNISCRCSILNMLHTITSSSLPTSEISELIA